MADDPKKKGPEDQARINVNEAHEVRYWTKTLGVTEAKLRSAVAAAGTWVEVRQLTKASGRHTKKPAEAGKDLLERSRKEGFVLRISALSNIQGRFSHCLSTARTVEPERRKHVPFTKEMLWMPLSRRGSEDWS